MGKPLTIDSYEPRRHPAVETDADGGTSAVRYERHGAVRIFTYGGGLHGKPFTTLEMYLCGRLYSARMKRSYSPRWFGRLANQFDHQCATDVSRCGFWL